MPNPQFTAPELPEPYRQAPGCKPVRLTTLETLQMARKLISLEVTSNTILAVMPSSSSTSTDSTDIAIRVAHKLTNESASLTELTRSRVENAIACVNHTFRDFSRWSDLNSKLAQILFMAFIPLVVGERVYTHMLDQIVAMTFASASVSRHVIMVAPRQIGKTATTLIMLMCSLVCAQRPDYADRLVVGFYAHKQKTAESNLAQAKRVLDSLVDQGYQIIIIADSTSKLVFENENGVTCELHVRSPDGERNRGVYETILIMDEMSFCSNTLQLHGKVAFGDNLKYVIAMSTPGDLTGCGETFANMVSDPAKYAAGSRVVNMSLICDTCMARPDSSFCPHLLYLLPANRPAYMFVPEIASAAPDDARRLACEMLGIQPPSQTGAFATDIVNQLFSYPQTTLKNEVYTTAVVPNILVITVDPAPGSDQSEFAIVSTVLCKNRIVVVGMDCVAVSHCDAAVPAMIAYDHVKCIHRAFPGLLSHVVVIPAVEVNGGISVARSIAEKILEAVFALCSADVRSRSETARAIMSSNEAFLNTKGVAADTWFGFRTAPMGCTKGVVKIEAVHMTRAQIYTGSLLFDKDMATTGIASMHQTTVTGGAVGTTKHMYTKPTDIHKKLRAQLLNLQIVKQNVTGKLPGHKRPDDLAIVFLLAISNTITTARLFGSRFIR